MKYVGDCINCKENIFFRSKGKWTPIYCSKKCHYEHKKFKITIGDRCNSLVLVREIESKNIYSNGKYHAIRWVECKCDCGNICKVELSKFKAKKQKTCGCYKSPPPDSYTHRMSKTHLYKVWNTIKQRCKNPNSTGYKNYGGRGVRLCDDWEKFEPFMEWAIKNGWERGLQIDKDKRGVGLLYSPETCSILTREENNKYKRNIVGK